MNLVSIFFKIGFKLPATEWTALVMKMSDSSTIQVHFAEILSLLVVLVDGVIQQLDDIVTTVDFNGNSWFCEV